MSFDQDLGVFVDANGVPIPEDEIIAALIAAEDEALAAFEVLVEENPDNLTEEVIALLLTLFLLQRAIGSGGKDQVTGEQIADTVDTFNDLVATDFAALIAALGAGVLTAKELSRRFGLSVGKAFSEYNKGFASRYNIDLPYYPPDRSICNNGCRCHWSVVTVDADAGDYDAFWVLDSRAAHCATCLGRASAYSPLQFRAGEMVNFVPIEV